MTEELIIPEKLQAAIKNNNLVFFVGAGCSMPLKFPSWKLLVEEILQDLNDKYGETSDTNFKNVLNGIKSGNRTLFEALNLIERDVKHGKIYKIKSKEIVYTLIEKISQNLPDKSSIHNILWDISKKIITTNYDKVLEKYKPDDIKINTFDNTNFFQSLKSQSNEAQFLYKIHGDIENPSNIILFESDYQDIYGKDNHNNDALATFFKGKTLLFIGFSLTDPFINDLFTKIKTIYHGHTINEHFVFTTKNEDFIEYDVTSIQIENWDDSLINYLKALERIKLSAKNNNKLPIEAQEIIEEELTSDEISSIVKLIEIKTKELSNNPANKELNKEVNDLRNKINRLMFGEMDYLQEVDKPFRSADLQSLFDIIYASEKLDRFTLERIQKVRTQTDIYKWYDRSVIVSSITCSLIHFNKADEQKISLLIDFINDNEEKVWQKAITSLFIILNHLGNKWLRFDSIKTKIKSLNQNLRIQNACSTIIQLFVVGLNNVSMISENLFDNSYFNENPFNYFLPYHQEENPAFDLIYDTYTGGDIEDFIVALNRIPIPDQLKYLFCSKIREDEDKNDESKKTSNRLKEILNLNEIFYPYSIYVQEIISFYKYFPVYKHKERLKYQLKLTETPLKDYLLNGKQKYSALGSHFMQEENWSQAIVNYKEAIKLDGSDISDLMNMSNCYNQMNEYDEELSLRIKIYNIEANNEMNLENLFNLYFTKKKDYNNSLKISNRLIKINDKNGDYFNMRGVSYKNLKDYDNALKDYNEAIKINSKDFLFYKNRANVYVLLNDLKSSLVDLNIAIEINPSNDECYYSRSLVFTEQKEYRKAIIDLNSAISINKKDCDYLLTRAYNYLYLSLFNEALYDIKKAESLYPNKADVYHAYSNYFRLTNDFDKAFENITKAEKIEKNFRFIGTKATIYASMLNDDEFYKFLEEAFIGGAEAELIYPDIKDKYRNEPKFIALLEKYNQKFL